ncbi:superoxide dismutase family protein [Marinobacter nanhaiticus D15-8W]|uniref:Superoxide dismutase [Cu-Zn] n=1 Tax=Marinobacter nanhaiticus D15-8W TaxID=626887 RepID=N6WXF0_9GAMM|nr:superoxide dismutase family protein [Marinobacter nanhaiticus]ENO16266.1 superoxide dismutase [Marinobacter nanhaiticus D15-8W]BES72877.1 superoxide dismutase family protein [Marinobacter nanhaiticus D15-8W]
MSALPFVGFLAWGPAQALNLEAQSMDIEMHKVSADGVGESIGTITVRDHEEGVLFEPDLEGLDTGLHGFHLHQNPDCKPAEKDGEMTAAASAGGHLNPSNGEHHGPFEEGHLGDLPTLYFDDSGKATLPVLAPRLEYSDLDGRALVIHAGGDNYASEPEPLGGGGARVACGVIDNGDD